MKPPRFLIDKHPDQGLLAAIDPHVRFTGSQIGETRFGGYLKPFPCEDAAREALRGAGAANIEAEQRKRSRRG